MSTYKPLVLVSGQQQQLNAPTDTLPANAIPTLNQNTTGSAGSVANALTINNSGSGGASGSTYTGAAAFTISYNSIGAAPLASPAFTGTPSMPTGTTGVTQTAGNSSTALATTAFVRTPGVQTVTSNATLTLAAGNDLLNVTALAVAPTFAAPSGTWLNGQSFMIQIDAVATARALTWNAIFQGIGSALPTTTVSNKTMVITGYYSSSLNKFLVFPAMNQP